MRKCDSCKKEKPEEDFEFGHPEADICEECQTKWFNEQVAYWKPLWEAEQMWKVDDETS